MTFTSERVARFFAERGWLVAFPQRRGRGASDGLYGAAVDYLRGRANVDSTRMLVAGSSRGGILSIAHIARRPEIYLGAVNFVGGWLGEGCGGFASVNRTLFEQGAAFQGPSLWLYAANDSFYSLDHSQANFAAFTAAGGLGQFETYSRAAGQNGHFLITDPGLWSEDLAAWLDGLSPP